MKKKILILNYGSGNYSSINKTLRRFNNNVEIGNSKNHIARADIIILPGVGTFPKAMDYMKKISIIKNLNSTIKKGKNILGICLGMQLLTDCSVEIQNTKGLKLIKGQTKKLPFENHIGWNNVYFKKKDTFQYLNGKSFFFQHQYYIDTKIYCEKGFFNIKKNFFTAMIKKKILLEFNFIQKKVKMQG